jgi:DDE superfamily endonuclease
LQVLPVPLQDAPLRSLAHAAEDKLASEISGKKRKRINTLKELLQAHPEFEELLLDATEQEVPQPKDKLKRKQAYSGKQHDHTIKTQIVATKNLILHVFGGLPGSLHDMMVLRASGVLHQIPECVKVRLDKGYQGADTAYPAVEVQQPIKKKRNHQVTAFGKAYNHVLSVLRMPVEHHFARLQRFGCLAGLWRGPQAHHEDIFCLVSGLLNFRATGKFDLA